MKIGYGKIGRSMPLLLEKCGFVGGDNEAVSVLLELATRHPEDEFVLIGRNTGENPVDIGMPSNITNPWIGWGDGFRDVQRYIRESGNWPEGGSMNDEARKLLLDFLRETVVPMADDLDGIVLWMGQHGSANTNIPIVKGGQIAIPQDWAVLYVAHLVMMINRWREVDPVRRDVVWLNADPRNYLKARDIKWPLRNPVLTQYDYVHNMKHERYGDPTPPGPEWDAHQTEGDRLWESRVHCAYSRLEVCGVLPGTPVGDMLTFDDNPVGRRHFGLFINEARAYIPEAMQRKGIVRDWVLPLEPAFIHGEWSKDSLEELGVDIHGAYFREFDELYHSVRCTFTTPSSGSGWATTKPWEAFACGTVCFFHPRYDDHDHILEDADPLLRSYLRVNSPDELKRKIAEMMQDDEGWQRVVRAQREHYDRAAKERRYLAMMEDRLFGQHAESYDAMEVPRRVSHVPAIQKGLF